MRKITVGNEIRKGEKPKKTGDYIVLDGGEPDYRWGNNWRVYLPGDGTIRNMCCKNNGYRGFSDPYTLEDWEYHIGWIRYLGERGERKIRYINDILGKYVVNFRELEEPE